MTNCTSSEEASNCLQEKKDLFTADNEKRGFTFIYTFVQDGKTFTIFDHGIAFDATAEVVDEDCNVVCVYGGFRMAGDQDMRCADFQEGISRATIEWSGDQ